ncbi:MAG: hypothetical protein AB1744_14765 [Candidatus Zixiibacteriota bacterium]
MKKVLLLIGLVFVVVGISYVKVVRQESRTAEALELGRNAAEREAALIKKQFESELDSLEREQVAAAQTILAREQEYRLGYDSLKAVIDTLKAPPSLEPELELSKEIPDTRVSREQEIVEHYRKLYRNLPADLSDYERQVAIREIRAETARKFSISQTELKRIREKHNLGY